MSKEKKKTIIFTVILALVAICLIILFALDVLNKSGYIESKESKQIMEKFDKYFNSKDSKVIYYASSTCGYCELQTPILKSISEDYDMDYLYIDSTKLNKKQRDKVLKSLDIEHATPTTVVVKNKKVLGAKVGYTEAKEYLEFFKNLNLVPEDAKYKEEENITFISYFQYENLIKESGTNIIVIGQTTCSHCIAIKPALNSVAGDYNLVINYLNLTDMTEEENNKFFESLKNIQYNDPKFVEEGSFGTPLTLIVKNGKVLGYISGERTISQLVKEFKKYELIR